VEPKVKIRRPGHEDATYQQSRESGSGGQQVQYKRQMTQDREQKTERQIDKIEDMGNTAHKIRMRPKLVYCTKESSTNSPFLKKQTQYHNRQDRRKFIENKDLRQKCEQHTLNNGQASM
jgi:hypothetical protein